MSREIRFTDEFKRDAVAQVVERGYAVSKAVTGQSADMVAYYRANANRKMLSKSAQMLRE